MRTYLFKCPGGLELKTQAVLTQHNIIGMNPVRYEYRRTSNDGTRIVQAMPQLPGYFIGLFPDDTNWHTLMALAHPHGPKLLGRPISRDGTLAPLDPLTVLQIRKLQGSDPLAPEIAPQINIRPGDTVLINDGLHDGKRFRVQRIVKDNSKGHQASVLMDMFGGFREVVVDVRQLERVA